LSFYFYSLSLSFSCSSAAFFFSFSSFNLAFSSFSRSFAYLSFSISSFDLLALVGFDFSFLSASTSNSFLQVEAVSFFFLLSSFSLRGVISTFYRTMF
jgi:hypothetical protein